MRHMCSAALLVSLLCGCGTKVKQGEGKKEQTEEEVKRFETIGRIASVNKEDRFVLIQEFKESKLPAGTTLTSFGADGERTNLRLSGERMGLFSVADVRAGQVAVGDTVQLLRLKTPEVDPFPDAVKIKSSETVPDNLKAPEVKAGEGS